MIFQVLQRNEKGVVNDLVRLALAFLFISFYFFLHNILGAPVSCLYYLEVSCEKADYDMKYYISLDFV